MFMDMVEEYQGITVIKRDFDAIYDEEMIFQIIPGKKTKRRKYPPLELEEPSIIIVEFD